MRNPETPVTATPRSGEQILGRLVALAAELAREAAALAAEFEARDQARLASEERGPLLTRREAAAWLGVSEDLVDALVRRGELPAVRVGRRAIRIRASDLDAYVERQQRPSGRPRWPTLEGRRGAGQRQVRGNRR